MCVKASDEHFERSWWLEQIENCFRLNPRCFANNNMKLPFCHMTLITLQGSVHLYDEVDTFNCYIVKHLSLTLCTKFDELLPYCKVIVRKKTFGLFFCGRGVF